MSRPVFYLGSWTHAEVRVFAQQALQQLGHLTSSTCVMFQARPQPRSRPGLQLDPLATECWDDRYRRPPDSVESGEFSLVCSPKAPQSRVCGICQPTEPKDDPCGLFW